jgi:hypothetical protein
MPWEPQWVSTEFVDLDGGTWNEGSTFVVDAGAWDDPVFTPFYDCGDVTKMGVQKDLILPATQKVNYNFEGILEDLTALFDGVLIHKDLDGGDVT